MPRTFTSALRRCQKLAACALVFSVPLVAVAGSIDAVSSKDASAGMRAAISQGVDKAIGMLGAPNGFLNNPKYTIPLPSALEKADRALRMIGMVMNSWARASSCGARLFEILDLEPRILRRDDGAQTVEQQLHAVGPVEQRESGPERA